ncbi:MAG: hypothetical protein PHX87_05820 [Candidatus Peribacteraceae bacterium]|nr:hypothetical protein [Candidatus Peribacteraceae bacterium]MDD5742909.1 hypothetical protein [Candidatus Peribacteraceae bacterium]
MFSGETTGNCTTHDLPNLAAATAGIRVQVKKVPFGRVGTHAGFRLKAVAEEVGGSDFPDPLQANTAKE